VGCVKVGIRIVGDKELAMQIADVLKALLGVEWKEYPFYDRQRRELDETKTRLYASFSE
jgi:hypothetical protein